MRVKVKFFTAPESGDRLCVCSDVNGAVAAGGEAAGQPCQPVLAGTAVFKSPVSTMRNPFGLAGVAGKSQAS